MSSRFPIANYLNFNFFDKDSNHCPGLSNVKYYLHILKVKMEAQRDQKAHCSDKPLCISSGSHKVNMRYIFNHTLNIMN